MYRQSTTNNKIILKIKNIKKSTLKMGLKKQKRVVNK